MPRPDTKDEQVILQNLWIVASTMPEGADVPCGDPASARRLRFALYNAVKQFKGENAKPCSDQLLIAITTCALSFSEDGSHVLIRQKIATKLNQAVLGVLAGFELKTDEDRQAEESSARLLERLSAAPEPEKAAPTDLAATYGIRSR